MANKGIEYIRATLDEIVNGEENKKKKDAAIAEIEDLIASYAEDKIPDRPTVEEPPAYERMEYDAPDDEQLRASAEEELAAYKATGEKSVDDKIAELGQKYDGDLESAKSAYEQADKKAGDQYAAAKQNTDYDMLKRGLARSSIAANKKAELENGEAEAKSKLYAEYTEKVSEINDRIGALESQRQQALDEFNIAYAAKLTTRINELKSERDKKQTEVLKYNNSITEKEYDDKIRRQNTESDLYTEALNQRAKEIEIREKMHESDYLTAYKAIAEKLRGINKHDAREIVLNNPTVRNSVGSVYYYKLYDEFCR